MDWSKWWRVGTRLIPDKEEAEWKLRGIVPVLPGSNVFFTHNNISDNDSVVLAVKKPMYLCCAYDEMNDILSNVYEGQCLGKTFHYQLKKNRMFIEEIERNLMAQVARLYRIDKPLIFAPDARRAVDICVLDGLVLSELKDYATQKDGKLLVDVTSLERAGWQINLLGGRLRVNDCLILTNIEISQKPLDFANDGEDEKGRYFDVQGNLPDRTFILPNTPLPDSDILEIVPDKNGRPFRVYVNHNVDLRTYQTMTFNEFNDDDWINEYQDGDELPRLRTAGDIDEFCRRFENNSRGNKCSFKCVVQPGEPAPVNIIRRYERIDRYPDWGETQIFFQARRYRPTCYLNFVGERQYLSDWAEYVLSVFEKMYPEFIWVGVYDGT